MNDVKFDIDHLGYSLVEGRDYTKSQKINPNAAPGFGYEPILDTDGTFYVEYEIRGKGNYDRETVRTEKVKIGLVNLNTAIFAESAAAAKPGEYYVIWDKTKLLITNPMEPTENRPAVQPGMDCFTIMRKISETDSVALSKDTSNGKHAYTILPNGYGDNNVPGKNRNNFVTIQGNKDGGYIQTRQLPFTLYTNMEGATTTETSLITPGAIITKPDWMETYNKAGEKGLILFNQLSFGERGTIDPDEYNLNWDATFDPANPGVGDWTVRVSGTEEGAHCYYGTITIKFRVVNGIQNATISVGGSNAIQYKGPNNPVVVTAPGVQFRVTSDDGKELTLGKDYEILGYTGNDRIGEAIVTIQGINDYSGTVDHKFKVTYPISSLVVFMKDPVKDYVNRANENVSYGYTGKEIEPPIMLYCPLDFPENTTDVDYLKKTPLDSSLYELGYENNIQAGTGTVVIKNCPYFTDSSADAQRGVTFSIVAGNIAPPPVGTVSYTSSIYANVEHIVAPYTGENYTVADLAIKLTDKGEELKENVDYVVYYDGDTLNVSDPANKPKITFSGVGNYAGSSHVIEFTIEAKSISSDNTDITADPIQMTYTDQPSEQAIIKQMNVQLRTPSGRMKKLVFGTDFEILNYFSDAYCQRPVSAANGMLSENGQYYIPTAQGTYYARISGIGNFKNTREITIEITKKDLTNDIKINFVPSADSDCMIDNSGEPDCTYNGREHRPAIKA